MVAVCHPGGLSPGRFVHGGGLSMEAGCLGASCHPGWVVSGGRLSWGGLSRAGLSPGQVVPGRHVPPPTRVQDKASVGVVLEIKRYFLYLLELAL